ncbi:putative MRPL6-mitochondrial ribosomal large subunit protein [Rutstroemia sp. NJR-2017a BBW]|nr:putative MRPL6-mitochondrial ribosomal large subunit protein [Rutstroemia sp. NJR-2017a BBW]
MCIKRNQQQLYTRNAVHRTLQGPGEGNYLCTDVQHTFVPPASIPSCLANIFFIRESKLSYWWSTAFDTSRGEFYNYPTTGENSSICDPRETYYHDPAARRAVVTVEDREVKKQREMWGVSEGHSAILRLVGVGYRATVEKTATTVEQEFEGQQFVSLKVGYSHPIELPVPRHVKATVPQPTRILLEGPEKEVVLSFAAKIRAWRVPEPYKGKGIFVNGETIKLKSKKIK